MEGEGPRPGAHDDTTPATLLGDLAGVDPLAIAPETRYTLGNVLGRGGMGEVLSARDEQIGRAVAIKRMRGTEPGLVARFVREAQIQGRLDHPSVVPVYEMRRDVDGRPCFVMKQLTGTTLHDVIIKRAKGDTSVTQQRLLRAFADICLAIEFAHTRGVIHRDLKPANIVLGDFGEVYVLDWGVARITGEEAATLAPGTPSQDPTATAAGAILGTPGYMAPEQIRADPLDARADVYSLGCILFELLALRPLHPRGEIALVTSLAEADARPSAHVASVAPELDAICVRATRVDREQRFATARELGDAVQQFLDGDRDEAMRLELASEELAQAKTAAKGTDSKSRSEALRAAARALALSPRNKEAADLVGRLMLEPPSDVPREVDEALENREVDVMMESRKLLIVVSIVYMMYLPYLYWVGFHDHWFLAMGAFFSLSVGLLGLVPRRRILWAGYGAVLMNAGMVAIFARETTPFLIAPSIGVIAAMALAVHPRIIAGWLLAAVMIAAVVVPWLLEVSDVLSRTTRIIHDKVVLSPAGTNLDERTVLVGFVTWTIVLIGSAVMLARQQAAARRSAERAVELQAWQLRQLVR